MAIQLLPELFTMFLANEHLHWLTYSMVHVTPVHFGCNMLAILSFGSMVEKYYTQFIAASVFVLGAITGWLFHWALFPASVVIGASAGIYAWMAFYCYQNNPVYLFAAIKINPLLLLAAASVAEFYFLFTVETPILSHAAHLGGISAGLFAAEIYTRINPNAETNGRFA